MSSLRRARLLRGSGTSAAGSCGSGLRSQARAGLQVHGDERRAIAQRAGIILVAGRLMDARLRPELGLDRIQAHAVRLAHAIAAAFADALR